MRKSKLMKALLVFGMSAVTATSIVGFAACDNGEGGGGGTGGHKHSYDGWLTSATEHWQECVADGEEANRGAHVDDNNNGRCDTCDYELAHTYASEWTNDDPAGHYHVATCDHTSLNDGVLPHEDDGKNGGTAGDNICDVCGYVGAVSDGYKALAEKAGVDVVLSETFFAQDKKLDTKFTSFGGTSAALYARPESGTAETTTHYLNVTGGSAVHVTDSATNVGLVADFGGNLTGKVVEGYMDLSPNATGNDWSVLKFFNGSNCDDANRVFSLHTKESGGTLGYSLNDKATKYDAKETVVFAANPSTPYRVYYKFDLTTGRVTATVNDKVICEDLYIGVTSLSGYEVISSNKGQRLVTVDNLITVTRAGTVEEYKAAALLSVGETEAKLPESLQNSEAKTTAISAIEAAETIEACDTAYNTYYSAVVGSYKNYVQGIITSDYAGKYTTEGKNKEAYAEVENALTSVLNGTGVTIDNAISAYNTFVAAVAELHDDDYYKQADVVITVANGKSGANTVTVKEGDSVTKAQLDALVEVQEGYFISGYYTDSDCTAGNEVSLPLTATSATSIYAKVEVKKTVTYSFDGTPYNSTSSAVIEGLGVDPIALPGSTGLYVVKGATGSDIKLGKQNSIGCVQPGGAVGVDKTAIIAYCGAGEVTVTVSYFQGSAGRYVDVLDKDGKVVATSSDTPTTDDKAIKTAALTFTLTEDGPIYIGSHASGLYISSITVVAFPQA